MFNGYGIYFNNLTTEDLELNISERPELPTPQRRYKETEIPGANGTYVEEDGFEDIPLRISFNFPVKEDLWNKFNRVKKWINLIEDNRLILSENTYITYRVKKVEMANIVREYNLVSEFELIFTCESFPYITQDLNPIEILDTNKILNCGEFIAKPMLHIKGSGKIKLIFNNKVFEIENVENEITIDSTEEVLLKNNSIALNKNKGEYPVLTVGENTFSYEGNITSIIAILNTTIY